MSFNIKFIFAACVRNENQVNVIVPIRKLSEQVKIMAFPEYIFYLYKHCSSAVQQLFLWMYENAL